MGLSTPVHVKILTIPARLAHNISLSSLSPMIQDLDRSMLSLSRISSSIFGLGLPRHGVFSGSSSHPASKKDTIVPEEGNLISPKRSAESSPQVISYAPFCIHILA